MNQPNLIQDLDFIIIQVNNDPDYEAKKEVLKSLVSARNRITNLLDINASPMHVCGCGFTSNGMLCDGTHTTLTK